MELNLKNEGVKVGFLEDEPVILAALAAKISQTPFEKGSIRDLYQECREDKEKSRELVNRIMRVNRHMIFGDFLPYAITLEEISRFAAIYFWRNISAPNLIFGTGIEASLRVIKPNRYKEVVSDFGKLAFEIYEKAIKLGVPEQDARYLLPEGVLTRMIFSAPPRYLIKIANSLKNAPLKELQEIGEKIEALIKEKFGLEIPTEEPISEWKFWGREEIKEGTFLDYQGNLHSLSLNMEVKGGLSMFAQLVRQRQFLCEIEPLEQIAKRGEFAVPPSFPEKIKKDYQEIAREARKKQIELIEKKDPNFVYFLLLGQVAKAMVYGKGYGIIETSKSRSCGAAQWEIRNVVGIPITEKLGSYFELKEKIGPRCWREKRCIEPSVFKTKKQICKVFELSKGNWKETLEKLLETLKSRVKSFN